MTSHPPWGPGAGRTRGAAIIGIDGHLVEAAAAISNGLAAFDILGLPDTGIRETRDRVRAAVLFPVKSACRTDLDRRPCP